MVITKSCNMRISQCYHWDQLEVFMLKTTTFASTSTSLKDYQKLECLSSLSMPLGSLSLHKKIPTWTSSRDIKQQFYCSFWLELHILCSVFCCSMAADKEELYEHFRSLCWNNIIANINLICISKAFPLRLFSAVDVNRCSGVGREKSGNLYFNVIHFHDMQIHRTPSCFRTSLQTREPHSAGINFTHAKIFQHHLSPLVCVYALFSNHTSPICCSDVGRKTIRKSN